MQADVAKLADALDSGSSGPYTAVEVQSSHPHDFLGDASPFPPRPVGLAPWH